MINMIIYKFNVLKIKWYKKRLNKNYKKLDRLKKELEEIDRLKSI